jgi:hypothetical protein
MVYLPTQQAFDSDEGHLKRLVRLQRGERAQPELADAASLYRGLVGRWDVDVIDIEDDGTRRTSRGEWHFGWALEGHAIQDVFIVPARPERSEADTSRRGNRYGTTVRFLRPDAAGLAYRLDQPGVGS